MAESITLTETTDISALKSELLNDFEVVLIGHRQLAAKVDQLSIQYGCMALLVDPVLPEGFRTRFVPWPRIVLTDDPAVREVFGGVARVEPLPTPLADKLDETIAARVKELRNTIAG